MVFCTRVSTEFKFTVEIAWLRWAVCKVVAFLFLSQSREAVANPLLLFGDTMLAARSLLRFTVQPVVAKSFPAVQFTAQPYLNKYFSTSKKEEKKKWVDDESLDLVPVEEIAASIDTTLTPEQKIYVDKLKKKIRGGALSERCTTKLYHHLSSFYFKPI